MIYKLNIGGCAFFILMSTLFDILCHMVTAKKLMEAKVVPFEKWDRWVTESYLNRHRKALAYYESGEKYATARNKNMNDNKMNFALNIDNGVDLSDPLKKAIYFRQDADLTNATEKAAFQKPDPTEMPPVGRNPEDWYFKQNSYIRRVVYERFRPHPEMIIHTIIEFGDCKLWNFDYEKESTIFISESTYLESSVMRPVYKYVVRSKYDDYLFMPEDMPDQMPACCIGLMWTYPEDRMEDYRNDVFVCNGDFRFIFEGRTYDFYFMEIWIPANNTFMPVFELQIYKPYITLSKHNDDE